MIVLQTSLLAGHLLAMNIAAAGPLACVILQWVKAESRSILSRLISQIAILSLFCFVGGAALGIINGLTMWFRGEERYFLALERLPSKISYGLWELAFYVFCMAVYIGWWKLKAPKGTFAQIVLSVVGLAAATNLLWHFPALMTAISHLADVDPVGEAIDAAEFRKLIFDNQIMSRWLHVWLASFATTGVLVCWLTDRMQQNSSETPTNQEQRHVRKLIVWGGRAALTSTLLQLPVGMWVLMTSPQVEQSRLMGGDLFAASLFVSSILLALVLMHQLAALAMGSFTKRNIQLAALLLALTITLMSATLILARGDAFRESAGHACGEANHSSLSSIPQ